MKILVLLFACFMAFDAGSINDNMLAGNWILIDQTAVNYPEIVFGANAAALFKSRGDTLYSYQYRLMADSTIELVDVLGKKYTGKIVQLNSDSLIFLNLIHQKGVQLYTRKKF